MEAAQSFGELLRRRRKGLDLTQAELARRAGCTESLIRKIEADERRPSRELADHLAVALAVAAAERPLFVQIARGERRPDRLPLPPPPPLAASTPDPSPHTTHLPQPLTPFVGRAAELAMLDRLLADPALRLITIVGTGGMGKTRLALVTAARQASNARFADGVSFVDLTPIAAPEGLATALAGAFGLEVPTVAGGRQPQAGRLFDYLRARRTLLVLDNFEHLLDGVPLLADLLREAPGLAFLVTSRERLRLHGEQQFPLDGLTAAGEAAELFVNAARRANPDFVPGEADMATIESLGELVAGMPLALELAGAWAAVLTVPTILAEVRGGLGLLATDARGIPERQQSVRAVCDATWRRLAPPQQAIFARLAPFRGGFTRAAAESVAGASARDLAELAGLALIRYDQTRDRYTLHELLRQYADEQLARQPEREAATRDAHLRHYRDLLAGHGPALRAAGQAAALAQLVAEGENIAAAWQRATERRDAAALVAMAGPLGAFHELRADGGRGAAAFGAAAEALARRSLASLAGAAGEGAQAAEAQARYRLARTLDDQGKPGTYEEYIASLALCGDLGLTWEEAQVRYSLASLAFEQERFADAEREGRACLALRKRCGDPNGIAGALQLLSQVVLATGRLDDALKLAWRCHAAFEALGDRAGIALGLRRLSVVLSWHGRIAESLALAERSLALYRELGMVRQIGQAHYNLSLQHALLGQGERAEEHAHTALANDGQFAWLMADNYFALGFALVVQGRDAEAEGALREALARHSHLGTAAVSWAAPLLALIFALQDRRDEARRLLIAALPATRQRRAFMPLLMALPVVGLLLAAEGDLALAAEIQAVADRYALSRAQTGLDARWRLRLAAALAALTPEERAAAEERGRRSDLWSLAEALPALFAPRDERA